MISCFNKMNPAFSLNSTCYKLPGFWCLGRRYFILLQRKFWVDLHWREKVTRTVAMDSLEAVQLPTSRTFWNSHDPSLDPFDETLVPTMVADPLEACSSTFQQLFPSTGSACDESHDESHQAIFKLHTQPHHQTNIFDDHNPSGASESSLATAQSYSTNACDAGSMHPSESSHFTWSLPSSPPHYHPQAGELGASDSQGQVGHYDDLFGPLSLSALDSAGHGAENQVPFLRASLMREPSFRQLVEKDQRTARASWQPPPADQSLYLDQSRRTTSHKEQPLGSPCSVISGFTKALQGGDQAVGGDYNMATSLGPSTSPAHGHESPITVSGTQEQAGHEGVTRVAMKRKRSKVPKLNNNEVESQRMTHIAVERNRRKQMNEHLAALRALMPGSYVQKGDQASIVGGAIEFVKELEHLLVCLQSQKRRRAYSDLTSPRTPTSRLAMPNPDPQHGQMAQPSFSFHSPQGPFQGGASASTETSQLGNGGRTHHASQGYMSSVMNMDMSGAGVVVGEAKSEVASVEVRMAGAGDAVVVKVMALRRAGQLLRTVVALESLALTVVHANITTVNHTVLYSFQAHVGPLCRLSPPEIAAALTQTFTSLHSLHF